MRSDHQALKWLFSLKEPKSRVARWLEILAAYDFELEYRAGVKHGNADAMSRCPNPRDSQCEGPGEENNLRCGPCRKCLKRSIDMHSTWDMDGQHIRQMRGSDSQIYPSKIFQAMLSMLLIISMVFSVSFRHFKKIMIGLCPSPITYAYQGPPVDVKPLGNQWIEIDEWVNNVKSLLGSGVCSVQRWCNKIGRVRATKSFTPWCQGYSPTELKKLQRNDPELCHVVKWMESGKRPENKDVRSLSPCVRHYWNYWHTLEYVDGLLFKRYHKQDDTGTYQQFVVPRALREHVLKSMHNSVLSGHLGRKKTTQKLLQRFYWFQVCEDINLWVTKCEICQSVKSGGKKAKAPLNNMVVGAPLDRLSADILRPLPKTKRGNTCILVVTDGFTKWVELFALPDESAQTCAQVILNEVICRYGCPLSFHTDQGRNFQSKIFAELCKLLEIRKTRTSPRNPKGNGQTERFNKTLVNMIRAYLKVDQRNWDQNLGCLAGAYRATQHASTTLTPNLMMLGREVRLPHEIVFGKAKYHTDKGVAAYGDYVSELKGRMQKAHDVARAHLEKAAQTQKGRYDAHTSFNVYRVGDLVWLQNEAREIGVCTKLQPAFVGPYVVVDVYNLTNLRIQLDAKGKTRVIHHDKLKPFEGTSTIHWLNALSKRLKSKQ